MPNPFKIASKIICFVLVIGVLGCRNETKPAHKQLLKKTVRVKAKRHKELQYTEEQLIAFFDSVGKLPVQPLTDKAAFYADSVFKALTKPMQRVVSPNDFKNLKKAIKQGFISIHAAKQMFGELKTDSSCNADGLLDSVPKRTLRLHYFPFDKDKNQFYEFAVRIGDPEHCRGSEIFFFKRDSIIAKQDGYSRFFDDDVKYFKNIDGEAVVYRLYEFDSGSGIWWNNYFFYKYDGDKLIPVLNELENGNMQGFWGFRILWLESIVQKTNPLTIKMVYYNQFDKENGNGYGPMIVNDSTLVSYKWDKKSKTLQGQYAQSKISKAQILSYYLGDNELLFINSFHNVLKSALKSKHNKALVLKYLRDVKNYRDTVGK